MPRSVLTPVLTDPGPPSIGLRPTARPNEKTAVVYALLDEAGAPVYVGNSENLVKRLKAHRRQVWWHDVRAVTWQSCTPGPGRFRDERSAIATLGPRHNVNCNLAEGYAADFLEAVRRRVARRERVQCPPWPGRPLDEWMLAVGERRPLCGAYPYQVLR